MKLFFSKHFWVDKKLTIIVSILSVYGSFFLFSDVISFFFDNNVVSNLINGYQWVFIILGIVIGVIKSFPKTENHHKYEKADIQLGYKVGDFFEINGAKVIPFNTGFHVKLEEDNGPISSKSLQGQMLKKYYNNHEYLEADIKKSLLKSNLEKPTEIGVTILINPDQVFYLVALTELNEHGVVKKCTFNNVSKCLNCLWQYIGTVGSLGEITIPLLGTGMTRLNVKRIKVAQEIAKSFTAAIANDKKFAEKLTICISPEDFIKYQVDLKELDGFIKHICKYTKFNEKSKMPLGKELVVQSST